METLLIRTGKLINDADDANDNVTNTGLNFMRINVDAAIQELEMMAGPGSYKVSVLEEDTVTEINFGVDESGSNGTTLGTKFIGSLSSDTIITQAGLDNYFGGLGDDTFISSYTNTGMFGGDGNDSFVISKLSDLSSVNGGSGFDTVLLTGINTSENDFELSNIGEQFDLEHVDINDSDLDITDASLSSISLSNSSSNVILSGSDVLSLIEDSIFNIKTAAGDDIFHLESNKVYTEDLVAFNASNSEQTGTGIMLSIAGKLGFQGVIDGNDGLDTINLSNRSEAFFIHDAYSDFHDSITLNEDDQGMLSTQRISNIEVIFAGGGDDIIDLTSPDYLIGMNDMQIYGESGDDVIWGADEDQYLSGGSGDDVLFGGSGNDVLDGGTGSDVFEFVNDSTNGHDTIRNFSAYDDNLKIYITEQTDILSASNFSDNVLNLNGSSVAFDNSEQLSFEVIQIEYHII